MEIIQLKEPLCFKQSFLAGKSPCTEYLVACWQKTIYLSAFGFFTKQNVKEKKEKKKEKEKRRVLCQRHMLWLFGCKNWRGPSPSSLAWYVI